MPVKNLLKVVLLVLDETIIVTVALLIMWKLGVHLSPLVIAAVVILMGILIIIVYRAIINTKGMKATGGRKSMIGLTGSVVTPLDPEGLIRAHGELWKAECIDESIAPQEEVIVISIERLKLIVKRQYYDEQCEKKTE